MRRRLRRQRQMREALLLDLGALVYELHRQGRREPELLQAKAAELTAVDEEVRALAEALGTNHSVMQLVATGVAGSCENCGSLMSVDQRYCSSCGAPAVPALSAEGERPAFTERTDEYAALSIGPDEDEVEPDDYEYEDHELAAAYPGEPEGEEPYATGEYESQELEQLEDEGYESAAAEPPDEGVIRVSRMTPDAEEPEPEVEEPAVVEPEAEEPEPEPEAVEPEPADPKRETPPEAPEESTWAPPDRASDGGSDGRAADDGAAAPAGAPHTAQPPRALADDALDSAGKAIRSGIERGRQWLRGRRDEP